MNAGQYEGITNRLDAILTRMPGVPQPIGSPEQEKALERAKAVAGLHAFEVLLQVLDGWIEGARSNHDGFGHRGELVGCWHSFTDTDIRNMINDAARELGLSDVPTSIDSKEGKVR